MTDKANFQLPNAMTTGTGHPWWSNEEAAGAQLFGVLSSLQNMQASRRTSYLRYAGLYGDQDLWTLMYSGIFGARPYENRFNRLNFNVSQSMVDTVVSKHAAAQPRIETLTEGGDWEQQQRAKNTTKFVSGVFEQVKLYREAPLALRNAMIFGDGFLHFYVRNGKICCDVAFPGEFDVDDIEAIDGKPRQMFRTRYVAREVLLAEFADDEKKLEIIRMSSADDLVPQVGMNLADLVKVVEAWHLPSGEDSDDGRHALVTSAGVLCYDEWEYDCFPFVRCRWRPAIRGYYSQGLVDQLMGIQVEIQRVAKRIGIGIHTMGVPYYLVETGSEVVLDHLSNEVGHIVKYLGTKPEPVTNPVFSPEVYAYLENLYNKAYALAGISPLEAQANKPAGLDSAPSLREYADVASERHAFFSMEWQEFFKDCAWQVLRCAREIGDPVSYLGENAVLRPIKYSDCLLDDDEFTFKVQLGNLLPTTTSGKLSTVQDLANSGILTPSQSLQLLAYPDIESVVGKITAQSEYIDHELHKMLSEGEACIPEGAYLDLEGAIKQVTEAYLKAKCDNANEDKLMLVRNWLRDAHTQLQAAQQAAAPPPMPMPMPGVPPGMPPGAPMGMPPGVPPGPM